MPGERGMSQSGDSTLKMLAGVVAASFVVAFLVVMLAKTATDADASATVVAATIGLVGTLVTGSATVLVARIGDQRAQAEQERLANEHQEEASRLSIETALAAAKMLTTDDGKPSDSATTAGALWALARLGEHRLVVSMLSELYGSEPARVTNQSTQQLLDAALQSDDKDAVVQAGWLLTRIAPDMVEPDATYFPICLEANELPALMPPAVRVSVVAAMLEQLGVIARDHDVAMWSRLIVNLFSVWCGEPDGPLQATLARQVHTALEQLPEQRESLFHLIEVRVDEVKERVPHPGDDQVGIQHLDRYFGRTMEAFQAVSGAS